MWATSKPPIPGPTTEPIWKKLLFHVTALEKAFRGTSVGKNDARAAQPNEREIPLRNRRK